MSGEGEGEGEGKGMGKPSILVLLNSGPRVGGCDSGGQGWHIGLKGGVYLNWGDAQGSRDSEADLGWVGWAGLGDRDPDSTGPDVLLPHEDSPALRRPEEAPGHRPGAGQQPTCHVL